MSEAVDVARQVGQDVTQALEWRTFTYVDYVEELSRMMDLAGHLRFGLGSDHARLSVLHTEFGAHLLNAAGMSTVRIKMSMGMPGRGGVFRWEPAAEPEALGDDSADDFQRAESRPVPAPVAPVVPLPPAWVPVTVGVGAGQHQVATVPTRDTELAYIRAHVGVFNAPRGKRCVRRRNGSILKADHDPEVLFLYVLQHVPDWRDTLSVW